MNPTCSQSPISIAYRHDGCIKQATKLAEELEVTAYPLDALFDYLPQDSLFILFDDENVSLNRGGLTMRADFTDMIPRLDPHRLNKEMLVRAARINGLSNDPLAIDATAGLGSDALLLAAAGFKVHLFERNPVIAALLEDALARGRKDASLAEAVNRMVLHIEDSIEALPSYKNEAAVIVLDPMFPQRTKSAAVKKKFQLIHEIEQPCIDEQALLNAALSANPRRIIVKRPIKGAYLGNVKPHHSLVGKAIRYDCIEPLSLKH